MHRSIMIESTIEKKYDFTLMVSTLLLLGWGTVMIYSTSAPFAEMQYQNSHFFLQKHLVHILLGIAVLALGLKIDYHLWQKYASWMMLGMLLVLILVLIPEIGHEVKGGRRWLRFGSIGFQPVELLKIVLIIYVAAYLERKQEMLSSFFRGLTPNFLVTGFFLFLILLQPDFGSVILIATTVLMMLYVGGGRPLHIFGSLIGMGLIGGFLIASHSYRVKRILAFLNPWEDPLNSGFQIIQSYIALGTGGWFGKGLGESHQKLFFLPDAHTDFILRSLARSSDFYGFLCWLAFFPCSSGEDFGFPGTLRIDSGNTLHSDRPPFSACKSSSTSLWLADFSQPKDSPCLSSVMEAQICFPPCSLQEFCSISVTKSFLIKHPPESNECFAELFP